MTLEPEQENRTKIREAARGDVKAFEWIVKTYERRVLAVAYRMVGDAESARDVAQEVFLRMYRYLPGYRGKHGFFFVALSNRGEHQL